MLEPDTVFAGIESRFLEGNGPHDLTLVWALGLGDKKQKGVNRFAHEGLVRKVIAGHWAASPRMQALVRQEKIQAYSFPSGVISQLMREIGAGRPGLYSTVGLGTFVDPREQGGRMNRSAKEDLVELVSIDGAEHLRYKPMHVDVAIIRGTMADPDGNISLAHEIANLDVFALALAAHNCGGKVIVQVKQLVGTGELPPRSVQIPGVLVDAVVVDEAQMQNYHTFYDPSISGERRVLVESEPQPFSLRKIIARRAAEELRPGAAVNFGLGMPDGVAKLITERNEQHLYKQTVEHGIHGGNVLDGAVFGTTINATAMIDSTSQFDFYSGGGLDIAFLGMGEMDAQGNVNVSMLGGEVVGPGGFIDISQNAKKVVFCGTFGARGSEVDVVDGVLSVRAHGQVNKLVYKVSQITFSGQRALARGQQVLYVTERAVFRLIKEGVELIEVAPGIDVQADVLEQMQFTPRVGSPSLINPGYFHP
ncbi:Acetate CoA-transferase YdiF [Variovorax sp. PBL-E5]|nr:Acetate CoA-transferase YdiF [Variovorax sp. PBL-E5]